MNKLSLTKIVKDVQTTVTRHSPEILTAIGVAGMVTTTVLAVKATPKAIQLMEDKKLELAYERGEDVEELTPVETVKTTWKCYAPAVMLGVASTACLIGAQSVNAKRNAALATAYKLAETTLGDYREKVVETIGEEQERVVRNKVNQKRLDKDPASNKQIIITGKGSIMCYDPISARYFECDPDLIKKAEIELNRRMLHDISGYVSLNEFYDEIDLEHTSMGDELGWNTMQLIEINLDSKLMADDRPCVVIDFVTPPKYNYTRFM